MLMDMEIGRFIVYREDTMECLHEEAEAAKRREAEQAKLMGQLMRPQRRAGRKR